MDRPPAYWCNCRRCKHLPPDNRYEEAHELGLLWTPAGTAGAPGHAQPAALVLRPHHGPAPYRQDHPGSAGPPGDSYTPRLLRPDPGLCTSRRSLGRSRRHGDVRPPARPVSQARQPPRLRPHRGAAGQPVAVGTTCETTSSEAGWPRCTVPCRPSTSGQKQGSSIRPTIVWRRWRDTDSSDLRPNSTRSGAAEASATSRAPTGSTATGIERTPRSISWPSMRMTVSSGSAPSSATRCACRVAWRRFTGWRVERVAIAPRIDQTLRRELEDQGAIAQDLTDLTLRL